MSTTQHRSTPTAAVLGRTRTAGSRAARRTSLATIGAAALVGLAMAGPASARPDDGEKAPQPRTNLVVSDPVTPQAKPETRVIRIDDNALEQLQIGLGALGGMALAGAAAGAVSARRHHHHAV